MAIIGRFAKPQYGVIGKVPTGDSSTSWKSVDWETPLGVVAHSSSSLRLAPGAGLAKITAWAEPNVNARLLLNGGQINSIPANGILEIVKNFTTADWYLAQIENPASNQGARIYIIVEQTVTP